MGPGVSCPGPARPGVSWPDPARPGVSWHDDLMIVVVGEALVDLVIAPDGTVSATLGGAPYNVARAASRLGASVVFAGALSTDRFGSLLIERLHDDGVSTMSARRTDRPTTLAAAELDPSGSATYRFYVDGTSAPDLPRGALPAAPDVEVFFTGGLALVLEPMVSTVVAHLADLADSTMVVIDVNARPAVIDDRPHYLATLSSVLARADLMKVSDEDLEFLAPDLSVDALLAAGATAVVVTAGLSGAEIHHAGGRRSVPVGPLDGAVVDTIGAGDTFIGALMAFWTRSGLGRTDLAGADGLGHLVDAVEMAHSAAAIVVTRRGADPPSLTDLPVHPRNRPPNRPPNHPPNHPP